MRRPLKSRIITRKIMIGFMLRVDFQDGKTIGFFFDNSTKTVAAAESLSRATNVAQIFGYRVRGFEAKFLGARVVRNQIARALRKPLDRRGA